MENGEGDNDGVPTREDGVQWRIVYNGGLCTLEDCVHWMIVYNGGLCTMEDLSLIHI